MALKLKKYSDLEISAVLNSESDFEDSEPNVKPKIKQKTKKSSKPQVILKHDKKEKLDSETLFDSSKDLGTKKSKSHADKVSLRLKLRRSTEQSMYKIQQDYENEPTTPQRSNHNRVRTSTDTKNLSPSKEGKDALLNGNFKTSDSVTASRDQSITPQRSTRMRRPPLRLSHYQCKTLPSLDHVENVNESPSLRERKPIDYCEDRLILQSESSSLELDATDRMSRTGSLSPIIKRHTPLSKRSKRNRTPSVRDTDSDASSVAMITRSKSSRKSIRVSAKENSPALSDDLSVRQKENGISTSHEITNETSIKRNVAELEDRSTAEIRQSLKELNSRADAVTPRKRRQSLRSEITEVMDTPATPKSRSMKISNLTPSIGKRKGTLQKPATPLQAARARLHVSAVPKSLPCREEEFNNIFTFLKGKLLDKTGGCIYISGVPGTGKTATVSEVVKCLQKLITKGELQPFDYIAINGMKLTEPRQAYVQILKQLTGQTLTWEQAHHALEKRFHNKTTKMTLLLVDELDYVCTKRQDVVYNLLDWPTKITAHLVVITIANTMDLPERVLMGRVTSRLGLTRLTFQPYNFRQLQEIVTERLKNFNSFRSEAVQLVARKVSAVSGDARRALDICRRAMEIAELRKTETVSLQDVSEAIAEMITTVKIQAIKYCSELEKIFLQAVSAEVTRTSVEEVHFNSAYRQLESICSFHGIKAPNVTETFGICARLGANRILICEHSRNDIYQKILLNVSPDDIHYALNPPDVS